MSEKPFWKGKTCEEMAGLHVKVTFKDGSIVTGKTNPDADIVVNYLTVRLSYGAGDDPFLPIRGIDTIELLDDPKYERIDDIEDVREGDVFVANDGNKYLIESVDREDKASTFKSYMSYAGEFWLSNCAFAYALRRKPKLPEGEGLYTDSEGRLWLHDANGHTWRIIRAKNGTYVNYAGPARKEQIVESWKLCSDTFGVPRHVLPMTPAKAVEA